MSLYAFLGSTDTVLISSDCPDWKDDSRRKYGRWEARPDWNIECCVRADVFTRLFGYVLKDRADLLRFNAGTLKLTGSWTMPPAGDG